MTMAIQLPHQWNNFYVKIVIGSYLYKNYYNDLLINNEFELY